jgi:GPH family glycoside/pentoside/hexuronide:cation symporter
MNEKLSFKTKTAYAIGALGAAVGPGTIIPFWYTFFLTDIARVKLGFVSLFWIIVTAWDAINNPIVGFLSDRTRTRWGRRRPFLLFGAIPFGVLFILLWWVPPTSNQGLIFGYYLVVYLLFETTASVVVCPHLALSPELTLDHDERSTLVMYRMVITIAAGVLVPVLFGIFILPQFPNRDPIPFQLLAYICGAGSAAALLITFWGTRERQDFQVKPSPPLRNTIRHLLQNKPFRYALAIYVLGWMPVTVTQVIFAYYFTNWIGLDSNQISLLQGMIMMSAWLMLPVVLWLARRYEKKTAYILAASSWAVLMLLTLLVPQGARTPVFILCGLSGLGIAAIHLMPSAMLPDVIEVDELSSDSRQEGAYAGVTVLTGKLGQLAILGLIPVLLNFSGYVQPRPDNPIPSQPDSALLVLRLIMGILPALLLGASMIVTWFYPITRQRHREIRQALEERDSTSTH